MEKKLPIYDVVINDDESQGVSFISLVDEPAIQVDWIKLSKEAEMSFKADGDKQILYGPFLIPNKLIYRYSDKLGEYYVRFSAEQIEKIARKFNSDLNNKNLNFQHTDQKVDAVVVENWLVDAEHDKSKKFGFELETGSWFGGVYVKDSEFWNEKIKTEEVKGFSVEVLAELELALQKINQNNMQKEIKLGSAYLQDGETELYWEGDTLAVGSAVFLDEAMSQPAPEGIHMLENGDVIKVTEGKVEIFAPGLKFGDEASLAAYPWDQCIEDQMKQYGDKAIAEAVCGKIKSENMAEPAPVATESISMDQIQEMINARFTELNDEITALKKEIESMGKKNEEKYSSIEEKLSNTPAVASITSKEAPKAKLVSDFESALSRVRDFAKK